MYIDEDTCDWLGLPKTLEMHKQRALLLKNDIQKPFLQLRKAREDIYGLVQMLENAEAVKSQLRGYLAEGAPRRQLCASKSKRLPLQKKRRSAIYCRWY